MKLKAAEYRARLALANIEREGDKQKKLKTQVPCAASKAAAAHILTTSSHSQLPSSNQTQMQCEALLSEALPKEKKGEPESVITDRKQHAACTRMPPHALPNTHAHRNSRSHASLLSLRRGGDAEGTGDA